MPAEKSVSVDLEDFIYWRLSHDRATVSFPTIPGLTLSAQQLDLLLVELRKARAEMQPQHAETFPTGQNVNGPINTVCVIEREANGTGSILHIRDPGYGWLHYGWTADHAAGMTFLLLQHAYLASPAIGNA